jgi:hypothetical protein
VPLARKHRLPFNKWKELTVVFAFLGRLLSEIVDAKPVIFDNWNQKKNPRF